MTAVWNFGFASKRRHKLEVSGFAVRQAKAQRKNPNSIAPEAIRRLAFKDVGSSGVGSNLTIFGDVNTHHTATQAVLLSADAVLEQQAAKLDQLHAKGGFCCLHWEFDGTPQSMSFKNQSTVDALTGYTETHFDNGDVDNEDPVVAKAGSREVLVQRGIFITEDGIDEIFARPAKNTNQNNKQLKQMRGRWCWAIRHH